MAKHQIVIRVVDSEGEGKAKGRELPIAHVPVRLVNDKGVAVDIPATTNLDGIVQVEFESGNNRWMAEASAFGKVWSTDYFPRTTPEVKVVIPIGFSLTLSPGGGATWMEKVDALEGGSIGAKLSWAKDYLTTTTILTSTVGTPLDSTHEEPGAVFFNRYYELDLKSARGVATVEATLRDDLPLVPFTSIPAGNVAAILAPPPVVPPSIAPAIVDRATAVIHPNTQSISGDVNVSMRRTATDPTSDIGLWVVIRKSMEALSFNNYFRFANAVMCDSRELRGGDFPDEVHEFRRLNRERFLPFTDAEAYRLLKVATEAFVVVNCGVALKQFKFDNRDLELVLRRVGRSVDLEGLWLDYLADVNGTRDATLPYLALIRDKLRDVPLKHRIGRGFDGELPANCFGILRDKLTKPCLLELIWSYWHEEGMLVQAVNAITRRFQNVRGPQDRDPLANLEIDPLRPLNNLFWGYIQDEQHRLGVVRRNYEYDHHYGLRLEGRAVTNPRTADTRSKFLEAFHNLLHLCSGFFKQDDDTTVIADGFPVLNALKEVHLILSEGAHNQFGDLPSTSRIEMLMQQWLMARPEFREFLPTRIMVAYPEPWMDRVDAMKKIQGWTDTSVLNFRNLGVFGEQILLSIRYGSWNDVIEPVQATNWARFWRPEIQGYVHAYRSVTGVDLTAANVGGGVDATLPSVLLRKRLASQAVS